MCAESGRKGSVPGNKSFLILIKPGKHSLGSARQPAARFASVISRAVCARCRHCPRLGLSPGPRTSAYDREDQKGTAGKDGSAGNKLKARGGLMKVKRN